MTRVLDARYKRLGTDDAVIGFAGGPMRALTLDGEVVYDLSVGCGTCVPP